MRRIAGIAALLAAAGIALLGAVPAIAMTPPAVTAPIFADVDDFTIDSFDAVYELGRDDEGRSTLRTTERIVARFPDFDQNRGLIRDLVRLYQGHETELEVQAVTDENGAPRPYTTEISGDFLSVVMAVPEGEFVHGAQTYVVEYTQRDVTLSPDDADVDEFYWDVNGTDWSQPFGSVSARVTLAEELLPALTGDASCYRGPFGAGVPCELSVDGRSISTLQHRLGPYETVTVAIGFAPGTFAEQPAPLLERVPFLLWSGYAALAAAIVHLVTRLITGARGARTGRAIIAQYEPPQGIAAATSAALVKAAPKAMTATLLDLAVRRKIRLLHHEQSGQYGAQALDRTGLLPVEASLYAKLFGTASRPVPEADATLWFASAGTRVGDAAAQLQSGAKSELRSLSLVGRPRGGAIALNAILFIAALGLPVLHAVLTGNWVLMTVLLAVGINVIVWLLIFTSAALGLQRPRTMQGALLHDHLMGLREYIRLAEADRIRVLQSASGAEVGDDMIVQVYERLLPYAIIFDYEREWQAELARHYRETTPDWVAGYDSTSFSQSLPIADFHRFVASRPATRAVSSGSGFGSGSSFSSSFSGSSGGGFSGGGGGGGGGRGI